LRAFNASAMIISVLARLGRHGTWFLAGGLFIGLLLPPLATLLRPALPALIFVLTAATFLGTDWAALAIHARRPRVLVLQLAWGLVATPVIVALAARLFGLPAGLMQGLVLWAASPPLISVPAIALLLGLDGALALLAMAAGTLLMPFTLPPLVLGLIGLELGLSVPALTLRLTLFIGGAALVAALVRRVCGVAWLRRHTLELSGLSVLILLLFAIAIMDGVTARLLSEPRAVLLYAATALSASVALQALSFLVFSRLARVPALTIGLVGGNKNMAIVWANLAGAASPELSLFFATVQLPIYVLPALLKPIYRRLGAAPSAEISRSGASAADGARGD
jgi:bile acid:Na+ symporter, BASS family